MSVVEEKNGGFDSIIVVELADSKSRVSKQEFLSTRCVALIMVI